MRCYFVDMHISAEQYLRMYEGSAKLVSVLDRSGRRLQFPASVLRPFVTHSGIDGSFELQVDNNSKLIQIRRL
ncbi:DUF2835 domain-containing protein [Agaribacterium haliotis]|uniref:DUF2835 domain-containing protein n=1 Tax=Agaribacterium haliotis TaxID=2013869 RepID=UPI000BB56680|nr:DUF2835 domain-containing protein [Agaribacterium haliotis]